MYENRYGQKEIDGCGWRDMKAFNWHDWDLGSPDRLINTLVVLCDELSLEDRKKYLKVFDYRVPKPRDYASNKIHYEKLVVGSGLLQNDENRIITAVKECEDTSIYVDGRKNDGQGFYTDGSYVFHTRHPMNGTYGAVHLKCVVAICKIFKCTKFADSILERRICEWSENTVVPVISKTVLSRRFICRHPSDTKGNGLNIVISLAEVAAFTDDSYYKHTLLQAVKRNICANPEMMSDKNRLLSFYSQLSENAEKVVRDAIEDEGFTLEPYNTNRMFGCEDAMLHHNSGVAYSLGMSSSRIYNFESINNENTEGWYGGDGVLTAYADDFYSYYVDGAKDNPYRRPGTTVDDRERAKQSVAQGNEYLSSQDFVGGVSNR